MGMAEEDLRKKQKEKGLPIIDKAFITCLLMAAKGKLDHLNFVMDRTIGKLQPQINVQNNQINFTGLPREEIIKRGQEALKILEAEKE